MPLVSALKRQNPVFFFAQREFVDEVDHALGAAI